MANAEVGSQAFSGTLGGAATGAAIGSVVPGIGTVAGAIVGGAIGLVGGVFGGLSTSKARKKKNKYLRLANEAQQEREANAAEAQYLADIRKARITRASSLAAATTAGITTSSLTTSALSSIGSQLGYNISSLAEDRRLYSIYSNYMRKAGKAAEDYASKSAMFNTIYSTAFQGGMAAMSLGGGGGGEDTYTFDDSLIPDNTLGYTG